MSTLKNLIIDYIQSSECVSDRVFNLIIDYVQFSESVPNHAFDPAPLSPIWKKINN